MSVGLLHNRFIGCAVGSGPLLSAARAAPSVGFMQPWDFIHIDDVALWHFFKQIFVRESCIILRSMDVLARRAATGPRVEAILPRAGAPKT